MGASPDPWSAAHVFSDTQTRGTDPQTPKPFTHVPDTYLKYPNLEYNYHPLVSPFVCQPFVHNMYCRQRRACPCGATTLSDSHNSVTSSPRYYVPSTERHSICPIRHAVRFPSEAVSKGTGLGLPLELVLSRMGGGGHIPKFKPRKSELVRWTPLYHIGCII